MTDTILQGKQGDMTDTVLLGDSMSDAVLQGDSMADNVLQGNMDGTVLQGDCMTDTAGRLYGSYCFAGRLPS